MLADDIPHDMPVPLALRRLADYLDTYNLVLGKDTNYHAGPDDTDVTSFAIWAPTPPGEFMQGSSLVATVGDGEHHTRRLMFTGLRNFRGYAVKHQPLSLIQFRAHIDRMGNRLELYGHPRSRLNEYYHLLNVWDKRQARRTELENVLDIMALPLELFDKRVVLAYASQLIPEMMACRHMPLDYLENLFGLESLREQDIVYRSMKRNGRRHPRS